MDFHHIRSVDLQLPDAPTHFVKSLQQTGFAVLHEHPIDMNLVNEVYSMWSIFLILPRNIIIYFTL